MRFESQNRRHGEGLLRVSETTPGRGAAFSCGVFRTAGAAEAGGGQPATVVAARATADRDDVGSASRLARDDYGERGLAIARLGRRLRVPCAQSSNGLKQLERRTTVCVGMAPETPVPFCRATGLLKNQLPAQKHLAKQAYAFDTLRGTQGRTLRGAGRLPPLRVYLLKLRPKLGSRPAAPWSAYHASSLTVAKKNSRSRSR